MREGPRTTKPDSHDHSGITTPEKPHDAALPPERHGDMTMPDRSHTGAQPAGSHGDSAGSSGARGDMNMSTKATRPQKVMMAVISVLTLAAAIAWSANSTNLRIGARDVKGVVMPPGMIMTRDLPAAAMRDMAAVDPQDVSYTAPPNAQGDQGLQPRIENGVKIFDLDASVIKWNILPNEQVYAYAFNRQVPGPRIHVTQGDRIRINVTNHLPESTTVHWHGLIVPNAMDGPANVTQAPIEPGQSYTYEFTTQQAGTYFYHTHDHSDRQQALGLYGALIIDPKDPAVDAAYGYSQDLVIQLQEWLERDAYTYPVMPMEGAMPNFFTINGKSYPATATVHLKVGDKLRVRFIGTNSGFVHPMHIHGGPFKIIAIDGEPVPAAAQTLQDTVNIGSGQRYDVIWEARGPGKWLLHCHIAHHTTNNNVEVDGGGGLTMIIDVSI